MFRPLFATIRTIRTIRYSPLFAVRCSLFATIRYSLFGFSRHPATCEIFGIVLEIVLTLAAPAFDILFSIGCVLNTKIAYTTAEKLTFEAFY